MITPFRAGIRRALADPVLQSALDANAARRITVRRAALQSLSDPESLRQQARRIRLEVVANLDHYLEQFATRAAENGMIVHHAADADEANRLVFQIAREAGARLVTKSKTMVSEEIELNHHLEQAGLQVVETDLGEYIVQLRGERPAHIITPAVHLLREEVGQTFHEKLGVPLTSDIPTLTEVARQTLRQLFLQADIGLSGVNFGIAETGGICLLTNEGNGRMVTTVPRVHIALMGIERLVPSLPDLAVMLALLPRSATGQKLTVYTSLIHGPRRPEELDGAQQRHLILVDNGRRALQDSPFAEILTCIRCGACLNACPVFREIGGHAYIGVHGTTTAYPGPIGSVLSPAMFGGNEFSNLARASTLCGACKDVCPVGIDLPKLLLRVRAGLADRPNSETKPGSGPEGSRPASGHMDGKPPAHPSNVPRGLAFGLKIFTWMAVRPGWFSLAQRLAGFFGRLAAPRQPWLHMPAFTGWGAAKDLPRPAARPFRDQFQPVSPRTNLIDRTRPAENASATEIEVETPRDGLSPMQVFIQELSSLGGQVRVCRPEEAGGLVRRMLMEKGIDKITAWREEYFPPGLLEAVQEGGIEVIEGPNPEVGAGLTGALAGVAETGSLVLAAGEGRPMSVSLLPEIHLAVLRVEDIYPTLADLFSAGSRTAQVLRSASSTVLVSGPSRTADIEMTLTIGVHGPKEVRVFLLSEELPMNSG